MNDSANAQNRTCSFFNVEKNAITIFFLTVGKCLANFERPVLGGGGGGRPDYLQKLKVPEGYEKMIDY